MIFFVQFPILWDSIDNELEEKIKIAVKKHIEDKSLAQPTTPETCCKVVLLPK